MGNGNGIWGHSLVLVTIFLVGTFRVVFSWKGMHDIKHLPNMIFSEFD
jgi:hypothetical protein